jgi:Ca2+-binding EF-hand superfamily protein
MKRKVTIAIAIAALIPVAGTALANDKDKMSKAGASFDALDTNRDGRISRTEASADSKIVFAQADANGDGYIDNMEYSKAQKASEGMTPPARSQSESTYPPTDASGQSEPVTPEGETTTPPSDTETPPK